jgi:hypothetical protein
MERRFAKNIAKFSANRAFTTEMIRHGAKLNPVSRKLEAAHLTQKHHL